MFSTRKGALKVIYNEIAHFIGRLTKKYYFEDYGRVYPDGFTFDIFGRRREYTDLDKRNFLNHQKFYKFVAQFVSDKVVCDIGCGSGYGCKLLKESGANKVLGTDASKSAISYAKAKFGQYAEYNVQTCTALKLYEDHSFDVTVCSEVLEHIKEYSRESIALEEMRRVTKSHGIIILGTPNSELLGKHGFSFLELSGLLGRPFDSFVIFENALLPFDVDSRAKWEERLISNKTGVIVSENIDLSETVLPPNVEESNILLKEGIPVGIYKLENVNINTRLLHNTHSFVVVIINHKAKRREDDLC